jgi:hypothetical protein
MRFVFNLISVLFIYFTPMFKNAVTKQFSFTFYVSLFVLMSLVNAIESTMSTLILGFFSTRTTRKNGASGTYITFLTTITNLGHIYPTTIALYLINFFSQKTCSLNNMTNKFLELNATIVTQITKNTCSNKVKEKVRAFFNLPIRLKNKNKIMSILIETNYFVLF